MLVNLVRMFFAITLLGVFVACSSTSNVTNSNFIQKRKYQSGFHIASRSKNPFNLVQNSSLKKELHTAAKDTTTVLNGWISKEDDNELSTVSVMKDMHIDDIASINNDESVSSISSIQSKANVRQQQATKQIYVKQGKSSSEKSIKRQALKRLLTVSKKSTKSVEIDAYMLVLIILACIIPPLAVLLYTDVDWKKVAISLILCLFFYFPAIIYALLVLFDVL